MPKIAPIFRSVSRAIALAASLAAGAALSAESPAEKPAADAKPAPGAELRCHDKPVIARGQGFVPGKKDAEEAAKLAWLPKAQEIYADASWETAQQPAFLCAKQGLYMNCTAGAIPCGTRPGASAESKK
jgi:glucose/arabinose dehydrogenase